MRLTGGQERGRRLSAPKGRTTRPTAARVREAIFNILGPTPELPALDLYAGTGALGIEALSRGAPRAVFVERDGRALSALHRNLKELGLGSRAAVLPVPVLAALRKLAGEGARFGWVFLDPPYAADDVGDVLSSLSEGDLLSPQAMVMVEHDKRRGMPGVAGTLTLTDQRRYGDTALSFYRATGLC